MNTEEHALAMIERVRAKPLRFRDERVTMAHGAGGKATQALVEGLLALGDALVAYAHTTSRSRAKRP